MKHLLAAALSLSMLAAPAMAAPDDHRPGPPPQSQNQGWSGSNRHQTQSQPRPQYSYDGQRYDAVRGPVWRGPKGYDNRRWQRGQKLPSAYRNRSNMVDYRPFHLQQPPRGYVWVRVSNSVFLVNQRNGQITQIVLNLFY